MKAVKIQNGLDMNFTPSRTRQHRFVQSLQLFRWQSNSYEFDRRTKIEYFLAISRPGPRPRSTRRNIYQKQ